MPQQKNCLGRTQETTDLKLAYIVMYEWCTLYGVNGVLYRYNGPMSGVLYILTRYGG